STSERTTDRSGWGRRHPTVTRARERRGGSPEDAAGRQRTSSEDQVGEAVDLVQRGDGGVEVELGAADVGEGAHRVTYRLRGAQGRVGDPVRVRAEEGVVVAQVGPGPVGRVVPERVVRQCGEPRL